MAIGIRKGDMYLGTRKYPDRKKPSLVFEVGNTATVIGSVKDEELWEKALEQITGRKAEEVQSNV